MTEFEPILVPQSCIYYVTKTIKMFFHIKHSRRNIIIVLVLSIIIEYTAAYNRLKLTFLTCLITTIVLEFQSQYLDIAGSDIKRFNLIIICNTVREILLIGKYENDGFAHFFDVDDAMQLLTSLVYSVPISAVHHKDDPLSSRVMS